MEKSWFSLFDTTEYSGKEPAFFDVKNKKWVNTILENQATILTEFQNHLKEHKKDYSPYFNKTLASKKEAWKTIGLKFWEVNKHANQKKFPKTTAIINQIPNLVSASFNKLEAGANIKPHNGDCNGYYRCHLGLIIPSGLPNTGFRVKSEKKPWKEGELFAFCDAHNHEAFNFSDGDRYVFLFDIIREEYIHEQTKIVGTVLTSLFLQKVSLLFTILPKKANRRLLIIIVFVLKPVALTAKTILNKLKLH
ncbi:MAG: aspartyl/asparaginyl beta-hydroxylase domain-containing protein [Flavobacteriaceae bacterium]|nr:aspartyl/asparaginyl beta-hydroxylase domain-containing protein [Flavobacteriaceae bacterium]